MFSIAISIQQAAIPIGMQQYAIGSKHQRMKKAGTVKDGRVHV